MTMRKTAISVPVEILDDVDRAAHACGQSRSKYITRVLEVAVRARRNAEITRRLNELFADERLSGTQHAEAAHLDDLGSDWTNERW